MAAAKIGLIQIDGTQPNLALMKLSAWHKRKGDDVVLLRDQVISKRLIKFDKVYISCIFSKNRETALKIAKQFDCSIELGGYGINEAKLLDEVEHTMPDYSLYDIDYSMGYTSRGCIRKCPWCIVWKKEGYIKDHAPITEFWNPKHKKVHIFDANFLASPKWRENLDFLIKRKLKVCFQQGLDIRLINEENARMLRKCRFYDLDFRTRRLYFAWDDPKTLSEELIREKIDILNNAGIKPYELMFYVLCGFNTVFEEDMYRVLKLKDFGVDPYPMLYDLENQSEKMKNFQRWVILKRFFKTMSFEKFRKMRSISREN